MARRPKSAKLVGDDQLREYVQERLSGRVRQSDGAVVPGPATVRGRVGTSRDARIAVGDRVESGADFPPAEA